MGFFSFDGAFYKIGTFVFDVVVLGFLWFLLTSLGFGITFGVVTTALYSATYHVLVKEDGYLLRTFFEILKKKLLKSTLVWIILAIMYFIIIFNIYSVYTGLITFQWLLPLYLFIFLELLITTQFIFPLIGEYDLSVKNIFKYAFLLGNKHLPTSVLCILIFVATILIVLYTNLLILLFIIAAIPVYLCSVLITKRILPQYNLS